MATQPTPPPAPAPAAQAEPQTPAPAVEDAPDTSDTEFALDPEKLSQAAEALATLTPEGYYEMAQAIEDLAEQTHLPEAGVSVNLKLHGEGGSEVQITARAASGPTAWDKLQTTIRYIMKTSPKAHWSPRLPAAPTAQLAPPPPANGNGATTGPQYIPVDQAVNPPPSQAQPASAGVEIVQVTSVAHAISQNGKHFLLVKGGRYSLHGIKAWPEYVPHGVPFESWPIGSAYAPPPGMGYAVYDVDNKKVTGFVDHP